MSMHRQDDGPELTKALKYHGLSTDTPSQLADAFRLGWVARTPTPAAPPETVLITPLGVNPTTCADCGEWKGASTALVSSARRHVETSEKFSEYRDLSDARIAELEAGNRELAATGLLMLDDLATARNEALEDRDAVLIAAADFIRGNDINNVGMPWPEDAKTAAKVLAYKTPEGDG